MAKTTSRLGKGLNALIQPRITPPAPLHVGAHEPGADPHRIRLLPIHEIAVSPHQPRQSFPEESIRELADSIRASGVIQPIVVRSKGPGVYELVAGERRLRAARLAGLETIPTIVRELSDTQSFELALIENLQREDLAPLERARAYQHYLDSFGGTIDELAQRVSESRANVSNYLRLLKLHPEIHTLLASGELGMGQARAVAGIADPQRQLAIARLAVRRNLSVRQVEELAREASSASADAPPAEPARPVARNRHVLDVEQALSKAVGLRVRLYPGRKKNAGRVVIAFGSLEEFDLIAEKLGGHVHLE